MFEKEIIKQMIYVELLGQVNSWKIIPKLKKSKIMRFKLKTKNIFLKNIVDYSQILVTLVKLNKQKIKKSLRKNKRKNLMIWMSLKNTN